MKTTEQVWTALVDANPAPDVNRFDLDPMALAADLANLEKRSSEMTQLDLRRETPKRTPKKKWALGLATAVAVALVATVVLLQGNEQPIADDGEATPSEFALRVEATLLEYAEARNSGEIGTVMRMFDNIASVQRHPYAIGGAPITFGQVEIRGVEELAIAAQGSGAGLEIFDIQVDEEASDFLPNVTFSWRFHYGADGEGSGGEAGCYGGTSADARILLKTIKELDWGFSDPAACES